MLRDAMKRTMRPRYNLGFARRYETTLSLTGRGSGFATSAVSADSALRWRFASFRCFFASSFWRFVKA